MIRYFLSLGLAVVLADISAPYNSAQESGTPAKRQPSIRLERNPSGPARFEVVGIEPAVLDRLSKAKLNREQWSAVFAVFVDGESRHGDSKQPAVLGTHRIVDGRLIFEPKYPLEPGTRYRAAFDASRWADGKDATVTVSASFLIPKPEPATPTIVEHVFPSRTVLPENQLKFYLHFSAPMSRGEAYKHVRLLDAAGKAVQLPFLELDEELWDPTGRRFTLFFDPGRIKRGLKPREEVGPVLEEGKSYTFVIDRGWVDAAGNRLKESYRKTFRVAAPDDAPIDPEKWKTQSPAAGSTAPLVVTFPEPLDHALLHRLLTVTDSSGREVAGTITVTDEETRWHYKPVRPWQPGRYRLVVDTTLEDLAGNQIGKPFEVDVFRQVQRGIRPKYETLRFEVTKN